MENPFKPEDKVMTKVGGKEVEATVLSTWRNAVQVRTPDNERRWRTIYTVWNRGASPIARPVKKVAAPASAKQPSKQKQSRAKATKRSSKRKLKSDGERVEEDRQDLSPTLG